MLVSWYPDFITELYYIPYKMGHPKPTIRGFIPSYTRLQPWLNRVCWGYNYLITRGAPSCILFPPVLYIIYPGEPNAAHRIQHLPGRLSFAVGCNKPAAYGKWITVKCGGDMQQKDVCRNFIQYFGDNILVTLSGRDSHIADNQHDVHFEFSWSPEESTRPKGLWRLSRGTSQVMRRPTTWCSLHRLNQIRLSPITAFVCTQAIPELFTHFSLKNNLLIVAPYDKIVGCLQT